MTNEMADRLARLASLVPDETVRQFVTEKLNGSVAEGEAMLQDGEIRVKLGEADLVEYRLKELNKIAGDLMDTANDRGKQLAAWNRWASRLRATLAAMPVASGGDESVGYSRTMIDSVMFDCPLKVEG